MKARSLALPLLLALIMVVPWSGGLGAPRLASAAFDTADETIGVAVEEGTPDGEADEPSDPGDGTTGEVDPSPTPTETPSATPTEVPGETPVAEPTEDPGASPTETPASTPDDEPSATPEASPTETPEGTPVEPQLIAAAQDDIVVTLNCPQQSGDNPDRQQWHRHPGDQGHCIAARRDRVPARPQAGPGPHGHLPLRFGRDERHDPDDQLPL